MPSSSYFVEDVQESIIKKHEIIFLIYVYINRINSRLVFKTKDGYKVELQMPETVKLLGSTQKLIDITENRENIPSLEVAEVVLVQCNVTDKQY